ncbi:chitin synthase III catalytic subunit [Lentinula aff. detonsa]|uniref:Chitin synthase III catalytic subunit n=1 Tax=Lentinula aff. detonsa TaxID=2804958 RepID=A0AA38KEQ2_9AGAR|nr:chitin synthase III catalytic subunit [Lentinula aff. detonsa]
MSRFGDFGDICTNVPSYTWCNLFYRQLSETSNLSSILTGVSSNPTSAPVGVNPSCGIPRVGSNGSVGNIGNIVVCALSMIVVIALISLTERRKAAVGRVELRNLLVMYFITLPFQLITNGSLLEQGSTVLVVLTAIHAALVATLFWALLANALVSTQVVEDGTMASLAPFYILSFLIFGGTLYIALDVALGITQTLGPSSNPKELLSIPLFIMTSFWPLLAAILYLSIMLYIILAMLKESRPTLYYILAGVAFVFSQLAWFLLGKVICVGSGSKLDGSFLATILETITVVLIFFGWKSITEGAWDETYY